MPRIEIQAINLYPLFIFEALIDVQMYTSSRRNDISYVRFLSEGINLPNNYTRRIFGDTLNESYKQKTIMVDHYTRFWFLSTIR